MKIKEAKAIAHTLSAPSKMPCFGYSIPAIYCKVGMKLRKVKNSICSICYAMKGRYIFDNVQTAMQKRYESLDHPLWVDAMVKMIGNKKNDYFRWHDSGDIQSIEHLHKIVQIALRLPWIKFWLPTREYSLVEEYMDKNPYPIPSNLTIRLSAYMIDGPAPDAVAERLGLVVSGVSKDSFTCPAHKQDNYCLDCRACWDKNTYAISYRKH